MATRKELRDEFEKNNSYKEATTKSYINATFNIAKRFGYDNIPPGKISDWFNYEKFFKLFEEVKPMTRRNYISAMIALLKVRNEESDPLFLQLSEHRDSLTSEYERIIHKKELTPSEREKWVEGEKLGNLYNEVKSFLERISFFSKGKNKLNSKDYDSKEIKKIRDAIFISIYLYPFHDQDSNFGVLRNDISSLYFWSGKKNDLPNDGKNYFKISRGKGQLIMRDYKTSKKYGEINIDLPSDLTQILKKWADFCEIKQSGKLFPGSERHHVTNCLQSFFKKHTGQPLSTQMLRKIYISTRFGDKHASQKQTASNMMHSPETQQTIYSKIL